MRLEGGRCGEGTCDQLADGEILIKLSPPIENGGLGSALMDTANGFCSRHLSQRYELTVASIARVDESGSESLSGKAHLLLRKNNVDGESVRESIHYLAGSSAVDRFKEIAAILGAKA